MFEGNDPMTAMKFVMKALSVAESCGDHRMHSHCLDEMAQIETHQGNYSRAMIHAHEAQRLGGLSADLYREAEAFRVGGLCCTNIGNLNEALFQIRRARECLHRCGLYSGNLLGLTLSDEAQVHSLKTEYLEAQNINCRIIESVSVEREPALYACSVLSLAEIGVHIGAPKSEVLSNLDKGRIVLQTPGDQVRSFIACDMVLADLHLRESETEMAKMIFQQCLISMRGISGDVTSYCLERLADVTRWKASDFGVASTWTVVYLAYAQKSGGRLEFAKALLFLGDIHLTTQDGDTAHSLFTVALQEFTTMDVHHSRARCMARLGDLAFQNANLSAAIQLWKTARPLFKRSLQATDVGKIDSRLSEVEKEPGAVVYNNTATEDDGERKAPGYM
ncbi:hypothetical protein C8F04DRAFT_1181953 [Mycena alexandri]|uniref:Uncharacterized protein n=1 Tax=Mycena alexandri TaxID=1745969 RepID=A0AAD6SYR8_9AGAR|nr:hypothetical protein C8F04DRAFT_1181953 [Mycena alexandri]